MSGQPILMPKLGLTMTEGVLAEWKVAPGDRVALGDILFVVETDKIANEIEASEAGEIGALLVAEGDVVPVGAAVARFAGGAAVTPVAPVVEAIPRASVPAPAKTATPSDRRIATPLARRMATGAGLDLATINGSGPRGRIQADDITAALATKATAPVPDDIQPLGQYQKVAARRLTESKRDIPHFYVFAEVDVTDLLAARASLNADGAFAKLTVNHFLIAAIARALVALPAMNRVWAGEGVRTLRSADVGLAVEGPKGLVAPVLPDLGGLALDAVAAAATALVERARTGRLSATELEGGAITISNVGMFGATGLLPIINPGQSSILGVGRNRPHFMPDDAGQPRLRQLLNLSLSCDHRVIDGALAARFLAAVQALLEAPLSLLRHPQGARP